MKHLEKLYRGHWKGLFAPYARIFFLSRSGQQEPSYNGLKGTKERKIFSLTIFFSETIEPRKTVLGSLERALRALHEPSYNGLKGTKERKIFSLTIFFAETIAPRKTGPGSLESALRALYAHIFFIKIWPIGAESRVIKKNQTRVIGKGSSRPTRPYFFYQDLTNRGRVITKNRTGVVGKGSSRPTRPYFFCQDLTNRSRKNCTGVIGKGSSRPTRPYFFCQDLTNRSRVITHLEKPDWVHRKGLFAHYTAIFFLSRSDQ
ncbi:hypothetical protein V1477_000089 [Vespula maculifrons]|uniref:Ribosomal protein S3 n=1 Tax=Vespula maculifrons TaxID=7453 RepID=A0ABD2D2K0_VESMC